MAILHKNELSDASNYNAINEENDRGQGVPRKKGKNTKPLNAQKELMCKCSIISCKEGNSRGEGDPEKSR